MVQTLGPWHQGYAVNCSVLGAYVTVVCTSAEVAEAIAALVADDGFATQPDAAMVGRLPKDQKDESSGTRPRHRLGLGDLR